MTEGWVDVRLCDIGRVFSGNSINAKEKSENYVGLNDGIPYVATKDVALNHSINYDNGVMIPADHAHKFRLAPAGSAIVCAEGGSAGRKVGYLERDAYLVNKLYAVAPEGEVIGKFLFYFFLAGAFKQQFFGAMSGLIGGVSLAKFKHLRMPLPPIAVQQRIVRILDIAFEGIDTAIANAEQNLANCHQLRATVFDMAARGRLGIGPSDLEGAAEFLDSVQRQRQQWSGKKKPKHFSFLNESPPPINLPSGWR